MIWELLKGITIAWLLPKPKISVSSIFQQVAQWQPFPPQPADSQDALLSVWRWVQEKNNLSGEEETLGRKRWGSDSTSLQIAGPMVQFFTQQHKQCLRGTTVTGRCIFSLISLFGQNQNSNQPLSWAFLNRITSAPWPCPGGEWDFALKSKGGAQELLLPLSI